MADLHSIGGLVPLLGYLKNSHPNIRAKAAEVVSTIVQNNPKSQQLVMEANGLEPLFNNFTSDPDVTVRTKALGAISCECLIVVGLAQWFCFWFIFFIPVILNDHIFAFSIVVLLCNDLCSFSWHIVALIRHNRPGITAFRLANGYAGLRDALSSESVRFQR